VNTALLQNEKCSVDCIKRIDYYTKIGLTPVCVCVGGGWGEGCVCVWVEGGVRGVCVG